MSRLSIINDALILSGNTPRTIEWDGSDEWTVAEVGFRHATRLLFALHDWNFTTTTETLARLGSSPTPKYAEAFALPAGCLHLKAVFIDDIPLTDYEIVNNSVCCRYQTGIKATFVREPAEPWPNEFETVCSLLTEAACWRGLNEDNDVSRSREAQAQRIYQDIKTRSDQQSPGRAAFTSRVVQRRRFRSSRWPSEVGS